MTKIISIARYVERQSMQKTHCSCKEIPAVVLLPTLLSTCTRCMPNSWDSVSVKHVQCLSQVDSSIICKRTPSEKSFNCSQQHLKAYSRLCTRLLRPMTNPPCGKHAHATPPTLCLSRHLHPPVRRGVGAGQIEILCMNLCIYILICICRMLKPLSTTVHRRRSKWNFSRKKRANTLRH